MNVKDNFLIRTYKEKCHWGKNYKIYIATILIEKKNVFYGPVTIANNYPDLLTNNLKKKMFIDKNENNKQTIFDCSLYSFKSN